MIKWIFSPIVQFLAKFAKQHEAHHALEAYVQ